LLFVRISEQLDEMRNRVSPGRRWIAQSDRTETREYRQRDKPKSGHVRFPPNPGWQQGPFHADRPEMPSFFILAWQSPRFHIPLAQNKKGQAFSY
jgi:hypothetical protein